MGVGPKTLRWLLNLYPPYLGAGVRVTHIADDWSEVSVEMALRWYNRNYLRTHFGGNLYSMVDPHLCLLLANRLGEGWTVWDKAASIEFVAPGRGTVSATMHMPDDEVQRIRRLGADGSAVQPEYDIEITDEQDQPVARVHKVLHARRKEEVRPGRPSDAARDR